MESLCRRINAAMEYSLAGMGLLMTAIVVVQVFCRYVLNHSLFWSEELARFLLVWLTFLGATVAYRRQVNPGIDILVRRLAGTSRRLCAALVHLSALVLFGVMVVYGYQFALFVRLQVTPALGLPKWLPHAIIPLSGAILAVHALGFLLKEASGRDG